MAYQLLLNNIELTIGGNDGNIVKYGNDGQVELVWETLFEAIRDLT